MWVGARMELPREATDRWTITGGKLTEYAHYSLCDCIDSNRSRDNSCDRWLASGNVK